MNQRATSQAAFAETTEFYRVDASLKLNPKKRAVLGQYMTPTPIARFIASLFNDLNGELHILDPGAGVGSLTEALVERLCNAAVKPDSVELVVYEIEPLLIEYLRNTLAESRLQCQRAHIKFYEQHELKTWIEQSLETSALPAGPGIFYVFRDEQARFTFQSSRYRRKITAPRHSRSIEVFNQHEALLTPLMVFVTERGRLPEDNELEDTSEVREIFGSTKKAFRIIQLTTSKEQWENIARQRAQELLIYLALSQFDGRPKYEGAFGRLTTRLKDFGYPPGQ